MQSVLKENVYLHMPPGFEDSRGTRNTVLKLKKSLYGLVQAPKCWNEHMDQVIQKLGYKPSVFDPCMYFGENIILLVYVDDILMFGKDDVVLQRALDGFKGASLDFTEEKDVFAFLGVEVDREEDQITLLQKGLIEKVLRTVGLEDANVKHTPAETSPLGTPTNFKEAKETWNYPSVVGMLLYLCSNSRPDIQFAVHQCARFSHSPSQSHFEAVNRIARYLLGTKDKSLIMSPSEEMRLDCFVDADYAGLWRHESDQDPVCVKSRSGYVITFGNTPVTWSSKLQTEIALSTLEAEYIALSSSLRELVPLRRLLEEIGKSLNLEFCNPAMIHSQVFEDNNGALILAESPKMTPRTKHIAVKYHWFRDNIGEKCGIVLKKIESENQKADILTKGLTLDLFRRIRKLLLGW